MHLWEIGIAAAVVGLFGGLTNAYLIQNRSQLTEEQVNTANQAPGVNVPVAIVQTNTRKAVLTYLGNAFLGAVAACASWAAYGAYSNTDITHDVVLTAATLASAFFIGLGGPKWLQSERDKGRWQAAATTMANKPPSPATATLLSRASSDQAPAIADAAPAPPPPG